MNLKTASLTPIVKKIICEKATEYPFTGAFTNIEEAGTYLCRQCGLALFRSQTKFHSGCGWPSFDENIPNAVKQQMDADGQRSEILCARCNAHLGHVFHGEGYTGKNTRHCVNSASLDFIPLLDVNDTDEAIFAAGCFWGVEDLFKKLPGVVLTEVGYSGGHKEYPNYEEVCAGGTGHYEAIRVVFDTSKTNYEALVKYFFEIHDPTQVDGQGPDLGEQYQSVIFYYNPEQMAIAKKLVSVLEAKHIHIATHLVPARPFWRAEEYHQNYYAKTGKHPYCHRHIKRFD